MFRSHLPDRLSDNVADIRSPTLLPGVVPGSVCWEGSSQGVWSHGSCGQGSWLRNVDDHLPCCYLLQPHHRLDHLLHLRRVHISATLDWLWHIRSHQSELFLGEVSLLVLKNILNKIIFLQRHQEEACFNASSTATFWNKTCTEVEDVCSFFDANDEKWENMTLSLSGNLDNQGRAMCTNGTNDFKLNKVEYKLWPQGTFISLLLLLYKSFTAEKQWLSHSFDCYVQVNSNVMQWLINK